MSYKSFGTQFFNGTTGAGTAIAGLSNIVPPEVSVETEDATLHSQADRYRRYITTLFDSGEVMIEGDIVSGANLNTLNGKIGQDDQDFGLKFPQLGTPITADFKACLTKLKIEPAAIAGKLRFSAALKLSGGITWGGIP